MMAKNRELQDANNNADLFEFKNVPTTLGMFAIYCLEIKFN